MTSVSRLRASGPGQDHADVSGRHDDGPPPTGRGGLLGHRRLLVAAAAALVVAVVLVWVVAFSSVFGVRTVDVRGAHLLTAAQIRSAAAVSNGTPLVRLDTGAVAARVERLPGVASARVSTSFPSDVVITVVERQPVGYVTSGSAYGLIDATGLQYRTVDALPTTLPLFVLPPGAGARSAGAAVGTVASALPATLRAQVKSIQAFDATSISLVLRDGVLVQWGTSANSRDKAQLIPTLLRSHPGMIDISDPVHPFTRP